ncbi:hypothetical protein C7N43_21035 [Sphingobacteriales bacterium UPWRP_1]|nr:hypothetical protein C7N43_21035 [Sphingobacteriales bacterium UPWRP_1]
MKKYAATGSAKQSFFVNSKPKPSMKITDTFFCSQPGTIVYNNGLRVAPLLGFCLRYRLFM